jgi:cysteine desulfurase
VRHEESARLMSLQKLAFGLMVEKLPGVIINGSQKHRLPNNIHITLPGQDNERLLVELDERGILAATGSACSASDDEPSHVLKAMGMSEVAAQASLRLTMGRETDEQAVRDMVSALQELLRK